MASDNPDIRQEVDANRGVLKKLELMVPGLRGYRSKEDIRVSDNLLRNQVADKLDLAKSNLEALRKLIATGGDFNNLGSVGSLIAQIQQFSGEIRHAEQGYSGFGASFQIDEGKLNKLYNYDYDFINSAVQLANLTSTSSITYDPTNVGSLQQKLANLASMVRDFKQKWTIRMEAVENIVQK